MTFGRTTLHALIIVYISILLAAFAYTMLRVRSDFLWPAVEFEYTMMAPFQHYATVNAEFAVFGLRDDVWEHVDLGPYLPGIFGERNIREFNVYEGKNYHGDRRAQYAEMARLILARESEAGRVYSELRFEWHVWPASPEGYSAKRIDPFLQKEIIFRTP
jgi:hypothetical protein